MSDLTRATGMAGRKRRFPGFAGQAVGGPPHPLHGRRFRLPAEPLEAADLAVARAAPNEPPPGNEQAKSRGVRPGPNDTELEDTIRTALSSTYSPLRAVVVVVTDGRVLLIGRIPSFYLKQVAQEARGVFRG